MSSFFFLCTVATHFSTFRLVFIGIQVCTYFPGAGFPCENSVIFVQSPCKNTAAPSYINYKFMWYAIRVKIITVSPLGRIKYSE